MSRAASELCVLLVDDIYGGLTSRLFQILLYHGRLSVPALQHHTQLSFRLVKHGLSVLVQQHLVLWYVEDRMALFEANTATAYLLVRSGKIINLAAERMDEFASAIVSNLLLLGHARVGDLMQAYGFHKKGANGRLLNAAHGPYGKPGTHGSAQTVGDESVSLESVQVALIGLLEAGLLSRVNESHFRSDADNRIEAERITKPPGEYKAKSKREQQAQWERSVEQQLDDWRYGTRDEQKNIQDLGKGKKRILNDQPSFHAEKRQRLDVPFGKQAISSTIQIGRPEPGCITLLDNNLVVRINFAKFAVLMRNRRLVELVEQSISTSTSTVYFEVLRALEPNLNECKERSDSLGEYDDDVDLSSLPQVSTDDLVAAIKDSSELARNLGTLQNANAYPAHLEHPKKRQKKEANRDNEAIVDGYTSPDEDEDPESDSNISGVSSDSKDMYGDREYEPNGLRESMSDPHRRTIRSHLLLLAQHPYKFLHQFSQTPATPEQWAVNFTALSKHLTQHTILRVITSRHGLPAARITRILSEKGKVDEKTLCSMSLMAQKLMRSYLTTMQKEGMLEVQEVPRDNARKAERTNFLWFFDQGRCKSKLLEETYKTMARCLQRAKVEVEKVRGTIEKASRTDVVGHEEELLEVQERQALGGWKEKEERIWGELGRLDDVVGILRDFGVEMK